MVTRTSPANFTTTSAVVDPTTSEGDFIMDQAPIYSRPRQKSAKSKLAMFAVPAALVLTAGIVIATSQPRSNAQQTEPAKTAAASQPLNRAPPPATTPAPTTQAEATPAPTPAPTATPAPARRTASTAPRRAVEEPASARDATSAAQNTSAVIAPTPAPAVTPPPAAIPEVVAPATPVPAAPEAVAPTQPEPVTAPPAASEAAPSTPPVQ